MTQTPPADELTDFETKFVDLFEQGKVSLPGEFLNEEVPAAETDTEPVEDLAEDEELDDDAEEDSEEDGEAGEEASDESGDEEDGGGEDSSEPVTVLAPPDPSDPNYDSFWDANIVAPDAPVTLGKVTLTPEQAVAAQRAYAFAATLGAQDVSAINALLSGEYRLVPVAEPGVPQPAPLATAQAATAPPVDDDYEPLDPVVADRVSRMEAEMEQLRAQSAQQANLQAAEQIQAASESWTAEHGYDTPTRARLEQAVFDNGWMQVFTAQTNGDLPRATRAALEFAAQSDPLLRQTEIDRLALEQAERVRAETQKTSAKKRKAGSLGGAGGSVSRGQRPPSTPKERQDAMVAEIASLIGSGQES